MRLKYTIILLVLNIAAFFYIYHLERQNAPEAVFDQDVTNMLPNALTIERIRIQVADGDQTEERVLERNRDRWTIIKPYNWPANDNAVQRILTQLQFLHVDTVMQLEDIERAGQSLADYGLDKPRIMLTYEGTGASTSLKIGAPTKMGSRLYVLAPNGKEVLVVSRELLESIDISLENLRSPQIFNIPIFEISSLRIQAGDAGEQRIVIEKVNGEWRFETPVPAPADPELVTSTLGMLAASQALQLIPASQVDRARMGLAAPFMRITISGNQRRQTLVLGGPVPDPKPADVEQRYAQLESASADGTVFTVNATNFDWLVRASDELRERRFFQFDPTTVTAIQITQGDASLLLQKLEKRNEKSEDAWQIVIQGKDADVTPQPGDTELIDRLLNRLNELKAEAFVSDAPSPANLKEYGFEPPNATIRLDNGQSMTLQLGGVDKAEPRMIFAKLASRDYVYAVLSRILGQVSANPLTYRRRILEQQPASATVTRLLLTDLQTQAPLLDVSIDTGKETWPVALEKEAAERREAILGLVASVKSFEVKNYLYDDFREITAAPWRYKLEATISLPGGESTQTIERTYFFSFREEANRQIGGSPEANMTFTLPQALIDDLFALSFAANPPVLPESGEAVLKADPTSLPAEPAASGPEPGPQTTEPPSDDSESS